MLKVWLVLYILGKVAVVWGPNTEITVDSCNQMAKVTNLKVAQGFDGTLKCVSGDYPPSLNSEMPQK